MCYAYRVMTVEQLIKYLLIGVVGGFIAGWLLLGIIFLVSVIVK